MRERETEGRKERGAERQKREMATEAAVATPKLQGAAYAHRAVATPPETDDTECRASGCVCERERGVCKIRVVSMMTAPSINA